MAAHTVTIPQRTCPVGPTVVGTASTSTSLTSVAVNIDRTVPGGLNSLPAAVTLRLASELSFDTGNTWALYSTTTAQGGNVPDDQGNPETVQPDLFVFNPPLPHQTQARLTVTAAGQPVVIAGSVTLTD